MSKSEEIAARAERYKRAQKVVDAFGRTLTVRRLNLPERKKIQEFTAGLTGATSVSDPATGNKIEIPNNLEFFFAASVRQIDEAIIAFPRNRADLDSLLGSLDDEGVAAVADAFAKFQEEEKAAAGDAAGEAKNS